MSALRLDGTTLRSLEGKAYGLLMSLALKRFFGAYLAVRSLEFTELGDVLGQFARMATPEELARCDSTFAGHDARTRAFAAGGLVIGAATVGAVTHFLVQQDSRESPASNLWVRQVALANAVFGVLSFALERVDARDRFDVIHAIAVRSGDGPSGLDGMDMLACVLPAGRMTAGQLVISVVALAVATLTNRERVGRMEAS